LYGDNFCFEKFISTGNYILLSGMLHNKSLTRKTHFRLLSQFFPVLPGISFVGGAFEDCLVSDKICKIATNHPHLLSVGDETKFVLLVRIGPICAKRRRAAM